MQETLPRKERMARRNAPGKRKPRAVALCEIKLSSVENLNQKTEQISSRQPLLAKNRCSPMQASDERKLLKRNNLVNSQLGAQQMSVHREETFEIEDMPITAPLELDLHSKDLAPNDQSCKHANQEREVWRGGEVWTSLPTTPGGCAAFNSLDSGKTANGSQQSNCRASETPSPPLDSSMNVANPWEPPAEMFNPDSAGKFSAERKRFSRRESSVGVRGSPETNSLICYIAKQKMQESQRISLLKSKMEAFLGTFEACRQDDNKVPATEVPHLSGLWQLGSTPEKVQDCFSSTSCSKPPPKKKVTFGGELSPELFDGRLPSNTPLRRGESPVNQKVTFHNDPPSVLKQGSKAFIGLEETKNTSSDVTCNGSFPVNDHGDSVSIKLQTQFEDDLELGAAGTHNVDEDICHPVPSNFESVRPLSEYKLELDNRKSCKKNNEYTCVGLSTIVPELSKALPLTINSSGSHGERSNARKDNIVCRNLTKKKTNSSSKKLSQIKPELGKKFAEVNDFKSSEMETELEVESNTKRMPCILNEMSKSSNGFLHQKNTDLSSHDRGQANVRYLSSERNETEDKEACSEMLNAEVSSNSSKKPKEELKTTNWEQEPKKEEPRRSTRIKNNVKNILNGSSTATKRKFRPKLKKDIYGKREYASREPVLSPIAEVMDIWSEATDLPDSDAVLKCEPSRRTSLIYPEGDIGREGRCSMSKAVCLAKEGATACSLSKTVGQKKRGQRPRKRAIPCFEEEQNILSDARNETQEGNAEGHWLVVKNSNHLNYSLESDDGQSPPLFENKKDMTFEANVLKNSMDVAEDGSLTVTRRKLSIKIKSSPFSKVPDQASSKQEITGEQSPSEGQCAMETGHEKYSEGVHAVDYIGVSSFVESATNIVKGFNDGEDQTDPSETEKSSSGSVSEKSRFLRSEPMTNALEEKFVVSPPDVWEVFRSIPSPRKSKFFSANDLPYVLESDQFQKVNRHCVVDVGNENAKQDEDLSVREKRKPFLSNQKMLIDEANEPQEKSSCESLLFSFGHPYLFGEMNTNIFETADQLETNPKCSDGCLQNVQSRKKVRRSTRLSGCMNKAGLTWIDSANPERLEKRSKGVRLSRRSFGLVESENKLSFAEKVQCKAASQARIRMLRRRSISCSREKAFELEEPSRKSIILD
ncbi:cell division cycle-associated protein 2 isoform X2 [Narcine bancroftii]